jgi:RNA polymerase sigma-70 factor, ECF subfamily
MDDAQTIQRLKNGDIGGLEALIARYQVKAIRTAFLITCDYATAEDVVQDTFVRIYQRIRHFDESRPFEPYLLRSVVHAAINTAEKSARHVPLDEHVQPGIVESLLHKVMTTEDQVEYAQLKMEISMALTKLSPRERAVIIERYYLEMSESEMALEHSIAPGTIKWLLSVARQHLRAYMGKEANKE